MKRLLLRVSALGIFIFLLFAPSTGFTKSAYEFLKDEIKPNFKKGHTLLPLTRWGWAMPFETRVELTENWGYALEFGGYADSVYVMQLENPDSIPSRLVALTASNPDKYPLFVILDRPLLNREFIDSLPDETWTRGEDGKLFDAPLWKLWSPEAPAHVFEKTASAMVAPLNDILSKAPIAIILNGGEYGLSYYGHSGSYWKKDPKILEAKGDREWFDYISERKAEQELIITQAVKKAAPDRKLYLWYHFGGLPSWSPQHWSYDYKSMRNVSDLPGQSLYFKHFNTGWTGKDDLLSQTLFSVAQALEYGDGLSYNWVNGGWVKEKISDSEEYMGFLKCLYTTGMLGAVAGYFSYPEGGFDGDQGQNPPAWLWQMMHLSRVHALFSHFEDFIRNGELLPGDKIKKRFMPLPAYEFETGNENARVLCRKHKVRNEWLITAWSADGVEREISVKIPGLGRIKIISRACGSVYHAILFKGNEVDPSLPKITMIDKNGMLPSL